MEKHKEREKRRTEKINCSGANVSIGKLCYDEMNQLLESMKTNNNGRYPVGLGVKLVSAEVFEHAGKSAIYAG